MKTQELYDRLVSIWNDYLNDDDKLHVPFINNPPAKGRLLFVGMNPSFSRGGWQAALENWNGTEIDIDTFFAWGRDSTFCIETAIALEEHTQKTSSYFSGCRLVADTLELEWEHQDLFFYRQTEQADLLKLILENGKTDKLTAFGSAQYELSRKRIISAKPQCIVVVNATASRILLDAESLEYCQKRGCHLLKLQDREVPVLLAGMLTRQRAMDVFSRERLAWHIGQVLGIKLVKKMPY
jgi:hypothetical protein